MSPRRGLRHIRADAFVAPAIPARPAMLGSAAIAARQQLPDVMQGLTVSSPRSSAGAGADAAGTEQGYGWWALAVMCMSLGIISLDNTVLNLAIPALTRDLGASTSGGPQQIDLGGEKFLSLLVSAPDSEPRPPLALA